MYLSKIFLVAAVGFFSLAAARPVACNELILDKILSGELPKDACCSYGVCKGDVNIQGA